MPGQSRRYALENAIRVALVGSIAFALTFGPLDDPHAATFAIFGTFGLLLFVDFGGSRRTRLRAYLWLGAADVVLIALGTLCSRSPWAATAAMAVVGFAILFSGVLGGTFAAASTSAILVFVLSVTLPAPPAAIDSRLLGWAVAAVLAIPAALLLWPARPRDVLRTQAAVACRAFARLVRSGAAEDAATVHAELLALRQAYFSTPYRPSGPTGPTAALAALVDDLDWLGQFAHVRRPSQPAFPAERDALLAAVAQALEATAAQLEGGEERPDFARLTAVRHALGKAMLDSIGAAGDGDEQRIERELEQAFGLRMLSYAAWHLGADGVRTRGGTVPDVDEPEPAARSATRTARAAAATSGAAAGARRAVGASGRLAAAYATTRSVWFRNSLRGALGLTLAVGIGQALELQHSFWVALGMVSVLRSRALSTGSSLVRALGGTLGGIVAGGLLIYLIGDHRTLLWIAFPCALLLATYAKRATSFAAGQGAFSLCVLVLFNLLEPVGWEVGVARIEDIALGGLISLGVGLLLWPRGATALLRTSVSAAYASSAAVLDATVRQRLDGGDPGALERTIADAEDDARRLDDAFRQCLAEPTGPRERFADLSRLVTGSGAVRRAAHSLRSGHVLLPLAEAAATPSPALRRRRELVAHELLDICDWLRELGTAVLDRSLPPQPQAPAEAADAVVVLRAEDGAPLAANATIAWSRQHLLALRRLEPSLAEAARNLAPRPAEERSAAAADRQRRGGPPLH